MGRYYDNVRRAFERVTIEMLMFELEYFGRVNFGLVREETPLALESLKSFKERFWALFIKCEYGMTVEELAVQNGADKPVIGSEKKNKLADMKKTPAQRQHEEMLAQNPMRINTMGHIVWVALCNVTRDADQYPQGAPWSQIVKRAKSISRGVETIAKRRGAGKESEAGWRFQLVNIKQAANIAIETGQCKYRLASCQAPKQKGPAKLYRLERIIDAT